MSQPSDEIFIQNLKETQKELSEIKSSGGSLVWAGFVAAGMLTGGLATSAYAYLGHDAFMNLSPLWYFAGGLVAAGPSLACIIGGFLARQSYRTARANHMLLRASQMLLMPVDAAGQRVDTLGTKIQIETERVNKLVRDMHASMEGMREDINTERTKIEGSVSQNRQSIDIVVKKLAEERQALAELTSAVDAQAAAMSEAIPRQARLMAEAARSAQQEVGKADDALAQRLSALDSSSKTLGDALQRLTEMSERGETSAAKVTETIERVEAKLTESAKTVDSAIRASELAASAAGETGDSLNAAVASALDGTREASEFIRMQSKQAVAEAMTAMAELKQAGEQAQATLLATSSAARAQADETEQRLDRMSDSMFQAASRATSAAEAGLERARLRIERASLLLNAVTDEAAVTSPPPIEDPREEFTIPREVTNAPNALRPRQDEAPDDDDSIPEPEIIYPDETPLSDDTSTAIDEPATQEEPAASQDHDLEDHQSFLRSLIDEPEDTSAWPDIPEAATVETKPATDNTDSEMFDNEVASSVTVEEGLSWKDLLAGLDAPEEERNEAARYILSEIEQSNVPLADCFNVKAVKKISGAARRGERQRRKMIREYAGAHVQTLSFRLQDDVQFNNSATRFLTVEEPDAFRALEEYEKSRSPATPRLAAFLLLDCASAAAGD